MSRFEHLPPAMRDLGDQLTRAAEREIEVERRLADRERQGRGRRRLRRAALALIVAVGVPAGSWAGVSLVHDGGTLEADRLPEQAREAAPGVISASAVDDPAGGPPWALKTFANAAGEDCVAVGRLYDGQLGQMRGRTFVAFPAQVSGACGSLRRDGAVIAVQQRPEPARTVVYGLAELRRPVLVELEGRRYEVQPGAMGSFLLVLEGRRDLTGASASVRGAQGARRFPLG